MALGVTEGAQLTNLRAFTAAGEAGPRTLLPLDEVPLPSSAIPAARVELGLAGASTPEKEVLFTAEADLLAELFSGTVPAEGPGSAHATQAGTCLDPVAP